MAQTLQELIEVIKVENEVNQELAMMNYDSSELVYSAIVELSDKFSAFLAMYQENSLRDLENKAEQRRALNVEGASVTSATGDTNTVSNQAFGGGILSTLVSSIGGIGAAVGGALASSKIGKMFFGDKDKDKVKPSKDDKDATDSDKKSKGSKAGKALKNVAKLGGKLFLPIAAAFAVFDGIKGFSEEYKKTGSILEGTIGAVKGVVTGFVTPFVELGKMGTDLVGGFFGVEDLSGKISNSFVELKDSVTSGIRSAVSVGKETLINSFESIKNSVTSGISSAISFGKEMIDKIPETVEKIKTKVTDTFTGAVESVSATFTSLTSSVTGFASSIGEKISSTFTSLTSSVTGFASSIGEKISSTFDSIKNSVTEKFESIKSLFSFDLELPEFNLAETIRPVIDKIKSFFDIFSNFKLSNIPGASIVMDKLGFSEETPKTARDSVEKKITDIDKSLDVEKVAFASLEELKEMASAADTLFTSKQDIFNKLVEAQKDAVEVLEKERKDSLSTDTTFVNESSDSQSIEDLLMTKEEVSRTNTSKSLESLEDDSKVVGTSPVVVPSATSLESMLSKFGSDVSSVKESATSLETNNSKVVGTSPVVVPSATSLESIKSNNLESTMSSSRDSLVSLTERSVPSQNKILSSPVAQSSSEVDTARTSMLIAPIQNISPVNNNSSVTNVVNKTIISGSGSARTYDPSFARTQLDF